MTATVVFALALVLQQTPGTPAPSEPTVLPPVNVTGERNPNEQVTCRSEVVTGSNRRRRVCMSADDRAAVESMSREYRQGLDQPLASQRRPTSWEEVLSGSTPNAGAAWRDMPTLPGGPQF